MDKKAPEKTSMRDDLVAAIKNLLGGGMAGKAADQLGGREAKLKEKLKESGG